MTTHNFNRKSKDLVIVSRAFQSSNIWRVREGVDLTTKPLDVWRDGRRVGEGTALTYPPTLPDSGTGRPRGGQAKACLTLAHGGTG